MLEKNKSSVLKKSNLSLITTLKKKLLNTSKYLGSGLINILKRKRINNDLYKDIEDKLIMADVGIIATKKIISNISKHVKLNNYKKLFNFLKEDMLTILKKVEVPLKITKKKPFVILLVGVNGVGKTTTAAKIAYKYLKNGYSTMLVAGDTFRASAVEQITLLGNKNNIPVFSKSNNSDSAAIIFDAIQSAKKHNIDIIIADTAGRLHNKIHLMEELKKIRKIINKLDSTAPHEIMLIIDANIGQNSISQTKYFNEILGITGITISKMDGTAKGGIIFNLAEQFNIPIRYICIGEKIEDLQLFQSKEFINAIFY